MEGARRDNEPVINIIGDKVALGPLRRDLLPLYQKWTNDFEVNVTLEDLRPATQEAVEAWYERAGDERTQQPPQRTTFLIYERAAMRPTGTTNLHRIDHVHRRAEFGIAIGEKDCWGKGYGAETATLMLDYGFSALGLHNIMLEVYSFNARGIRAYARAGFREIGRRREAYRLGGQAYDVILMDCLASEFTSPVLHRLLP